MADRRIYAKTLTTSGLAFTAGGLLYGAVLSSRAGGASFTEYNVAHATTVIRRPKSRWSCTNLPPRVVRFLRRRFP